MRSQEADHRRGIERIGADEARALEGADQDPYAPARLLAAMIASGFLGTIAGARMLMRMPETRFRLVFRILLTVLALDLMRRGVSAMGWLQ